MTLNAKSLERLRFLGRVIAKEAKHLTTTDQRLFGQPFTLEHARRLDSDADLAERVEAFVGRFSRLQDTLADKFLPALLAALGEPLGPVADNLDRAERLGWIASADEWMSLRALRNQMVHEYVEDPEVLTGALLAGHGFVASLVGVAEGMLGEMEKRGWE